MCLSSENTTEEELALVEALGKSMGDTSILGAFLQDVVNIIREGTGICLGAPQPMMPPQQQGLPPGWTMPNAN